MSPELEHKEDTGQLSLGNQTSPDNENIQLSRHTFSLIEETPGQVESFFSLLYCQLSGTETLFVTYQT